MAAAALGVFAGLGGATHGPGEMLQGNVDPSGLLISAWPGLTALNGEPAMTIMPSYLVAGILTIIVGVAVAVWAAKYLKRGDGALVMIMLSIMLLLVGGGLVPPIIGIGAGLLAAWSSHSDEKKDGKEVGT
jgi:hypothetical protein